MQHASEQSAASAAPSDPDARPYGTPAAPRVAVRGEARLEVEPEIARIRVTVGARGTDRRSALDDLTRRNAQVLELVRSYPDAIEKVESSAFSLTPHLADRGRRERVRSYSGQVHTTVTLTDFTVLGELTTRLADQELTRVDGPWWALRPDSAAHREARVAAAREAVRRAREYAEALGGRLVSLLELADTGAEAASVPAPAPGFRGVAYGQQAGGAAAPVPALDLEPDLQTVVANVTARFTMTPPDLS